MKPLAGTITSRSMPMRGDEEEHLQLPRKNDHSNGKTSTFLDETFRESMKFEWFLMYNESSGQIIDWSL